MESGVDSTAAADRRGSAATSWLIGLVLVWIGFQSVQAPSALPADAPDSAFSAERAIEHVTVIAVKPHPMGSDANAEVRDYIVTELESLGLEPELYSTVAPDYFGSDEPVSVVNVVARIRGTANTGAVALMAHYDTVPATPGANDNSSAVAALLETARALTSGPGVNNDILFLFTDGEEPAPRFGATALIRETSLADEIGFVVNLEAIGGSGPSMLVETSGPEGWIVQEFAAAAPHPVAFSFVTELVGLLGDVGTDFDPFRKAGVHGVNFVYVRGSPLYHTSADDLDSVGLGSLQHHGSNTLSVARHFGNLNLATTHSPGEAVFFTLRPLFVRYPAAWAVPLAVLTFIVFGWAALRLRSRRMTTLRPITAAAGMTAFASVLISATATLAWMSLVSIRSTPGVLESYLYFMLLVAVGLLVGGKVTSRSRHREPMSFFAGVVFLWVVLAVATAFSLPGFSYLFLWPALAGALLVLATAHQTPKLRQSRFVVVAAPAIILVTPAIETFLQMAQPHPGDADSSIPSVILAPLLLAYLVGAIAWIGWRIPSPIKPAAPDTPD